MTAIYSSGGEGDLTGDALTDTELDAALIAADTELLEHVKSNAHPQVALLAMMTSQSSPTDCARAGPLTDPGPVAARVAAVIEMRSIARRLGDSLARARALSGTVATALYAVLAIPRQLTPCYPASWRKGSGARGEVERWLTEVDSACAAWLASRSGQQVERLPLAPDDLVMGLPGTCGLDRLLDRAKGPVTYLAGQLDQVDFDALARELADVRDQANELAAMATMCCADAAISAKCATLAGTLDCLGGPSPRLVRALPRVHCMAVELRELAGTAAMASAGQIGQDCQLKVLYQLNYLTETVVAAHHDAEAVMTAIDTAVHQHPGLLLSRVEIDASGADLSSIRIDNLAVLDGVLWTPGTRWPPGTSQAIHASSRVIGLGRYRVGTDNADEHFALSRLMTARS